MLLDRAALDRWFSGCIHDFDRAVFLQDLLDLAGVSGSKSFLRSGNRHVHAGHDAATLCRIKTFREVNFESPWKTTQT